REPGLLEGRDQEVTLLATGLHGWAELAAKLQAEHACRLLRDMMDVFSERIVDQGGVIVESQADRLLAMWNAPMTQPDHALLASAAALGILEELPELNKRWQELAGGPLSLGIGLHLAEVQVGSMGSHHRFKYAPFGPSLEVVQGVQQATRKLARTVLITGPIQEQLPDTMATRRLCQARLTGLAEPVPLYELHSVTGTPEWLA